MTLKLNELPAENQMKAWTSLVFSTFENRKNGHNYIWLNAKKDDQYSLESDNFDKSKHTRVNADHLFKRYLELPLPAEKQEQQRASDAVQMLKSRVRQKYYSGLCGVVRKILSIFFSRFLFEKTSLSQLISSVEARFPPITNTPLTKEEQHYTNAKLGSGQRDSTALRAYWQGLPLQKLIEEATAVPTSQRQNYLTLLEQKADAHWSSLGAGLPPGTCLVEMAFDTLGGEQTAEDVKAALRKQYRVTLEREFVGGNFLMLNFDQLSLTKDRYSAGLNPLFFEIMHDAFEKHSSIQLSLQIHSIPLSSVIIEHIAACLPYIQMLELHNVNLDNAGASLIAAQLSRMIAQNKPLPMQIKLESNPIGALGMAAFRPIAEAGADKMVLMTLVVSESREIWEEISNWNVTSNSMPIKIGLTSLGQQQFVKLKAYWNCYREGNLADQNISFSQFLDTSFNDILKQAAEVSETCKPHFLKLIGDQAERYFKSIRLEKLALRGVFAQELHPDVKAVLEEKYSTAVRQKLIEGKKEDGNSFFFRGELYLYGNSEWDFYYGPAGKRFHPLFLQLFGEHLSKQPFLEPSYKYVDAHLHVSGITLDASEVGMLIGWFGHFASMQLTGNHFDSDCAKTIVTKLTELFPKLPKPSPIPAGQAIPYPGGAYYLELIDNPLGDAGVLAFKKIMEDPESPLHYLHISDKTVNGTLWSEVSRWKFPTDFRSLQLNDNKYKPSNVNPRFAPPPQSYEQQLRSHGVSVIETPGMRERREVQAQTKPLQPTKIEDSSSVWRVELTPQEKERLNEQSKHLSLDLQKHIKPLEDYLKALKQVEKIVFTNQLPPLKHFAWLIQQIPLCYAPENKERIAKLIEEKKIPAYLFSHHEMWLKQL